jgi:glycogen operon protein
VDIAERRALGLAGADAAAAARESDRRALLEALAGAGEPHPDGEGAPAAESVAPALHRFVGRTPCALALLQADDLAGERSALNLPGTDRERPNWRRRVAVEASSLWDTPAGRQASRDLAAGRGRGR